MSTHTLSSHLILEHPTRRFPDEVRLALHFLALAYDKHDVTYATVAAKEACAGVLGPIPSWRLPCDDPLLVWLNELTAVRAVMTRLEAFLGTAWAVTHTERPDGSGNIIARNGESAHRVLAYWDARPGARRSAVTQLERVVALATAVPVDPMARLDQMRGAAT